MRLPFPWEHPVGVLGLALLIVGHYLGLAVVPPDAMMGDVARIMYVHVPVAWVALLSLTVAFVAAVAYFLRGNPSWDALGEAATEVGVVLTALLIALGSIWGRPAWGVWWDWDPRLTTAAILLVSFLGVMALRRLVEDPERRAVYAAAATVLAFVDLPIVYFSVRWWRGLHQVQSTPKTVDPQMVVALRLSAFALLFIAVWLIARRCRLALARRADELAAADAEEAAS